MMESIFITLAPKLLEVTVSATAWMVRNWYISFPVLFLEYALLMKLWSESKGKPWELYYKVVAGVFFLPQDVVVNLLPATLLFLDPPPIKRPYELVTNRMVRYKTTGGSGFWNPAWIMTWRTNSAFWLCNLLNPYQRRVDNTDHC